MPPTHRGRFARYWCVYYPGSQAIPGDAAAEIAELAEQIAEILSER